MKLIKLVIKLKRKLKKQKILQIDVFSNSNIWSSMKIEFDEMWALQAYTFWIFNQNSIETLLFIGQDA